MDNEGLTVASVPGSLSDEERARIFSESLPRDRSQRQRSGKSPISTKTVLWALVIFSVLGLGGEAVEHYFGNVGVTSATTNKFLPSNANLTPVGFRNSMTNEAFIGLKLIANANAPKFTLRDQFDKKWSFKDAKGRVIVLTFENYTCNDICPVLGNELRLSDQALAKNSQRVEFVVVNTNPRNLTVSPNPPALVVAGLQKTTNVVFLTGTLKKLDAVWTAYGVKIKVGALANEVAHNNVMYFVGAKGQLIAQATPFAKVTSAGTYTLSANDERRFASGIVQTTTSLIK
jgi:cytochrome oxidase Cu insertion factor (SCO1/SenC/PrrC family)